MIRAIIFDLDGTRLDTERLKGASYAGTVRELRPEVKLEAVEAAFREVVGGDREAVSRALTERFQLEPLVRPRMAEWSVDQPWQALAALRVRRYDRLIADRDAVLALRFPEPIRLVQSCRAEGFRTGLATMSHRDHAERLLATVGLAVAFEVVVARDDVRCPKPDPEIYRLAARRLGAEPAECLAIEDSATGVRSALDAGIAAITVTNSLTRAQFERGGPLDREWVVDDPARLADTVRRRIAQLGATA